MSRLTQKSDKGLYFTSNDKVTQDTTGYAGDAVEKLAKFEDMYDDLISKQAEITEELEKLRQEGKMHTARFKQLLDRRIANNTIIIIFESCGCGK